MSPEQQQWVSYHSPEQRSARMNAAQRESEKAVSEAHHLFFSGNVYAARERLFSAGIPYEGVSYYIGMWSDLTR
jgi:hypothetical protein